MTYSNFTLPQVIKTFNLQLQEVPDLYHSIPPLEPSPELQRILTENIPLALAINTEKARSEFLIAPLPQPRKTGFQPVEIPNLLEVLLLTLGT